MICAATDSEITILWRDRNVFIISTTYTDAAYCYQPSSTRGLSVGLSH